jgi:hypothetical protein
MLSGVLVSLCIGDEPERPDHVEASVSVVVDDIQETTVALGESLL